MGLGSGWWLLASASLIGVSEEGRRACEDLFFVGVASDSDRGGGLRSEGCLARRGHDVVG